MIMLLMLFLMVLLTLFYDVIDVNFVFEEDDVDNVDLSC